MDHATTSTSTKPCNPTINALALRNFRLLWPGRTTSLVGNQFHMVAGAWQALKKTCDPLALGAGRAARKV
jgi:hypothetical protein